MALLEGTRLGVYEIAALIGVGGMGEVYRARDTKLNRDVALKVLPEHFAADPDRLARFKRESQVLASLNHPNIAAIYGFEEGPAKAGHYVQEGVGAGFSQSSGRTADRVCLATRGRYQFVLAGCGWHRRGGPLDGRQEHPEPFVNLRRRNTAPVWGAGTSQY